MAVKRIRSRDAFKIYCLRKLGAPVVKVNVDEDQVDDRVDEALNKMWEYHYDGRHKVYLAHKVTTEDTLNRFITLPPNINGAIRILPISSMFNVGSVFSLQYQIVLNDMWRWSSVQLTHFYQIYQYSQLMEQILVGNQPVRFTEHDGRLWVDMNWDRIPVGQYIMIEAYRYLNPDHISLMIDTPTGDFQEGEVVLAGNGATGTIEAINKQSRQELFIGDFSDTPFVGSTVITGQTSGATATIKVVADSLGLWNDTWLQNYATALIEKQWGRNLTKHVNVRLPSGAMLNGAGIEARADKDIAALEAELYNTFNMPSEYYTG